MQSVKRPASAHLPPYPTHLAKASKSQVIPPQRRPIPSRPESLIRNVTGTARTPYLIAWGPFVLSGWLAGSECVAPFLAMVPEPSYGVSGLVTDGLGGGGETVGARRGIGSPNSDTRMLALREGTALGGGWGGDFPGGLRLGDRMCDGGVVFDGDGGMRCGDCGRCGSPCWLSG